MDLTVLQTAVMIVSIGYLAGILVYMLVSMNILKKEFKRGAINEDQLIDGYVIVCIVLCWVWPVSILLVDLRQD